jgi:hypothetical protein
MKRFIAVLMAVLFLGTTSLVLAEETATSAAGNESVAPADNAATTPAKTVKKAKKRIRKAKKQIKKAKKAKKAKAAEGTDAPAADAAVTPEAGL